MKYWQQLVLIIIYCLLVSFEVIYFLIGILGQIDTVITIGGINLALTIWNGLVYLYLKHLYTRRLK